MISTYQNILPHLDSSVFVAPSADIIGDVEIGEESNIWFQVVIRGDVNIIRIGKRTNIQDQSCLHVTRKTASLHIGNDVTVGHRALLHGCRIGNRVLVGMGAIVMDNAVIPDDCVIGAGSLVTMNKTFEPASLIMGSPAKFIRKLDEKELAFLKQSALNYVQDAKDYIKELKDS